MLKSDFIADNLADIHYFYTMNQEQKIEDLFDKLNQLNPVIDRLRQYAAGQEWKGLLIVLNDLDALIHQTNAIFDADINVLKDVAKQIGNITIDLEKELNNSTSQSLSNDLLSFLKATQEYATQVIEGHDVSAIILPKITLHKDKKNEVKISDKKKAWYRQFFGK